MIKEPGVYILESLKNSSYYIGSTNNISERLCKHNKGLVISTRRIRPFRLRAFISCPSLTEAKKAEYLLKRYKRKDIIRKVIDDRTFPWNYNVPM